MRIFVCGDIINYSRSDGLVCSDDIVRLIGEADYSVCNFEAPIGGFGVAQRKAGCHLFQQKSTVSGLKKQGFDLLLLANNHMLDYGAEGLNATLQEISNYQLESIGAGLSFEDAYQPLVKDICGIKIGFVNACEAQFGVINYFVPHNTAGYAWINHSRIDKTIIDLKKECNYVIVFAHAGLENFPVPQKQWRERYKQFCDLGADCIVGSHPHVPQGYERYNQSLIFYSLGNFYFDSKIHIDKDDRSYSVMLDFQLSKPVDFSLVCHHKEDGLVRLSDGNKKTDIIALNEMLALGYEQLISDISLEVYERILKPNYTRTLCPFGYSGSIRSILKYFLNQIRGKGTKINNCEMLLRHLINNESYRFAAERALEVMVNRRSIEDYAGKA